MTPLGTIVRMLSLQGCMALAGLASGVAHAAPQCSATATGLAFGNVDLIDGSSPADVTGRVDYVCTNDTYSRQYVSMCLNIGDGSGGLGFFEPRRMGNLLQYSLLQGTSSLVWGSTGNTAVPNPVKLEFEIPPQTGVVFPTPGRATGFASMRGRLRTGQASVPPATYSSDFSGAHTSMAFRTSSSTTPSDCGTARAGVFPFVVSATVIKSCIVSADPLDFGFVDGLPTSTNVPGQSPIRLKCSPGTPFKVALTSQNNSGSTGGTGLMKATTGGNADSVPYQLYRDSARSQPWGNAPGTNTLDGSGNGQEQVLTVYGRIPSANVTPDFYKDTVTVRVTY